MGQELEEQVPKIEGLQVGGGLPASRRVGKAGGGAAAGTLRDGVQNKAGVPCLPQQE